MKQVLYVLFLIFLLTPVSCISDGKERLDSMDNSNQLYEKSKEPNVNQTNNNISPDRVMDIPEELVMVDYTLFIETYLWRDFMPITPPGGKPLRGVIKIIAEGIKGFPVQIKIKQLWIIKNKSEIWESESLKEQPPEYPNEKIVSFDNGPKWEPGIMVDVVVRITDTQTGKSFLLKASDQVIQRTD